VKIGREAKEWLVVGAVALVVFGGLALGVGAKAESTGLLLNYLLGVVLVVCIYALLALGLQLQFGFTGLINFGLVAFAGLAAYTMAIPWRVPPASACAVPPCPSPALRWAAALAGDPALSFLGAAAIGLLVAVLAIVPLAVLAERVMRRARPAARLAAAGGIALLLGVATALAMHPLDDMGARHVVAFLGAVAGCVVAALFALLLGLPAVRLREDYLAIVTLGAAELVESFLRNETWLTSGTEGIFTFHQPVARWARSSEWWRDAADRIDVLPVGFAHAVVAVLVVAYVYLVFHVLVRSPWGRVLKAIREDDAVASALGKNVNRFRLQALALGSVAASLAGILLAWQTASLVPSSFARQITFFAWIAIVLGGVGNLKGAIAGALVLWGITEAAGLLPFLERFGFRDVAGPGQGLFIGALLVLVMMLRPQGIVGRKEELLFGK